MSIRKAKAVWKGDLKQGRGKLSTESALLIADYSFGSRFEQGPGTNPEELLGAAHAGCFSMALAHEMSQAGHTPESVQTEAQVHLEKVRNGYVITRILLKTVVYATGIQEADFSELAESAKTGCPVSRALRIPVELEAELKVNATS